MKYISITFDDGREDNYSVALPIMEQYNMKGTVYITTGFVDGTWKDFSVLESPRRALSVGEIQTMVNKGWEIGLHGDKHTTEKNDFNQAYEKMNSWINNGKPGVYGFSVPNSTASEADIETIRSQKDRVLYIRKGRRKDNSGLTRKALYALSYYGGLQWAYDLYNKENVFLKSDLDKIMFSVVVKSGDKPDMILNFLDKIPDQTGLILMLHSILPSEEAEESQSQWVWKKDRLNELCRQLSDRKTVQVVTARELIQRIG